MRAVMRKPLCVALMGLGLMARPAHAFTDCNGDCPVAQRNVIKAIVETADKLSDELSKMTRLIVSEIQKQTQAIRHTQEGIATYRQQEIVRRDVRDLEARFTAPADTCTAVKTGMAMRETQITQGQAAALFTQGRLRSAQGEASPQARLKARQQASLADFCSDVDARAGRCSQQNGLPNGDITAAYLFGDTQGKALTYTPLQTKGVGVWVDRVLGLPPATLPTKCTTEACVAFDEFRKDYLAIQGLPLHSFSQIMSGYLPQKDLGRLSGQSRPHQPDTISRREMMARFVDQKHSAEHMKKVLEAPSSETLLREVLHHQVFQMSMAFELLRQRERQEALMAQKGALRLQWQQKPLVEAQRQAAIRSSLR
jgi:hypothetical protein